MIDTQLVVISGTSGSGKSIALHALEDVGYYCIDNLPAGMLTHIASNIRDAGETQHPYDYAVSIDSRNQRFLENVEEQLVLLDEMGINYQIIFLDADDESLLKRYSETRRKHPLTDKHISLVEAIQLERTILEPIQERAHIRINTSRTTPHELRISIRDYAGDGASGLTVLFESFGFKYGPPSEADFVFDVRCLPNPHWDEALRPHTGLEKPVREFLAQQPEVQAMFNDIKQFIDKWLPSFRDGNRSYITIAIGCTGGKHRSVYLTSKLVEYFKNQDDINIQIRHRELNM